MYKKILLSSVTILTLAFVSCGPAAEDRETMMRSSQRVADSIANLIRMAMKEAEMPANTVMAQPDTSKKPAAPTATPAANK